MAGSGNRPAYCSWKTHVGGRRWDLFIFRDWLLGILLFQLFDIPHPICYSAGLCRPASKVT